jgi:penicillin-binding protein 1A
MIDMLHSVVENGTARRARLPGINVAGKTGTTNAYRDAWFVGFTGNFATAVWFGNDDYESTERLTGGIMPAQTWQKYMRVAMAYEQVKPLPRPPAPVMATDEQVLAEGEEGQPLLDTGSSGRLAPETSTALERLQQRFLTAAPVRQASLPKATRAGASSSRACDASLFVGIGLALALGCGAHFSP